MNSKPGVKGNFYFEWGNKSLQFKNVEEGDKYHKHHKIQKSFN